MTSAEQPGFLVHVTDRAEIASHDLKVGVLPDIVLRHLEHAQVQVGHWAERAACDEHHRGFGGVTKHR